MNQMVVGRPKFRPLSEQWTANAVSEIRRLLVLGVLKNPKIEVTPKPTSWLQCVLLGGVH